MEAVPRDDVRWFERTVERLLTTKSRLSTTWTWWVTFVHSWTSGSIHNLFLLQPEWEGTLSSRKWWIFIGFVVLLYGSILLRIVSLIPDHVYESSRYAPVVALRGQVRPIAWGSLIVGTAIIVAGVVRRK